MSSSSPLARAEIACGVLLVIALGYVWWTPNLTVKNVSWDPPEPQPVAYSALLAQHTPSTSSLVKDSTELLVIQERPLFVLGRKPVPPASPQPAVAAVPEKNIWDGARVLGVFEGDVAGAIFHVEGKDHRLLLNQSFEGWTLRAVKPRSIEVEKSGKKKVIELVKADMSGGGKAVAPAPARRAGTAKAAPAAPARGGDNAAVVKKAPPPQAVFGGTASSK